MKFPINSICDNCLNDPFHKWNGNEIYMNSYCNNCLNDPFRNGNENYMNLIFNNCRWL